jgi:hypothetical protein
MTALLLFYAQVHRLFGCFTVYDPVQQKSR